MPITIENATAIAELGKRLASAQATAARLRFPGAGVKVIVTTPSRGGGSPEETYALNTPLNLAASTMPLAVNVLDLVRRDADDLVERLKGELRALGASVPD